MKVFAPRRIITNRRGTVDGSLEGDDCFTVNRLLSDVKKLRSQVNQLTVGKAEVEKEYMNVLSSIEKEKDFEFNIMQARIKATEESNSFLCVSKNSLVEKVIDLQRKIEAPKSTEEDHSIDACDQDQATQIEKLKRVLTSSDSNNKAIEETIQQLYGKCRTDHIAEAYNNEVKRNTVLEKKIQIILAREETTNKCLTKIKLDSDNSLLQQNKTIDTLKKTLGTYEEDAIKLQKELVHTKEKIIDQGTIELLQDTANKRMAKIKEDAENALLQKNEIIDTLNNALDSYKENKIELEKEVLSANDKTDDEAKIKLLTCQLDEKSSKFAHLNEKVEEKEAKIKLLTCQLDEKISKFARFNEKAEEREAKIKLLTSQLKEKSSDSAHLYEQIEEKKAKIKVLTSQLKEKSSESAHLYKEVEEKEKEIEALKGRGEDALSLQLEEQNLVKANLLRKIRQKEQVIDQVTQAANNLLSCQENVSQQKYVKEIEELKLMLQQKDEEYDSMSSANKKCISSLKQREADFHRIIQKHQYKLEKLDNIRKRHEVELEQTINDNEVPEEDLDRREENFQESVLKHEECLQNQGLAILELKKSLQSQMLYVAKSEIEVNLKELAKKDYGNGEENKVECLTEEEESESLILEEQREETYVNLKELLHGIAEVENSNKEKHKIDGLAEEEEIKCVVLNDQQQEKYEGDAVGGEEK